jgi:DNA-binding beta-propeller fold protein YncE
MKALIHAGLALLLSARSVAAESPSTATVRVWPSPYGIAVDEATHEVYVISSVGVLSIIDASTHRVEFIRVADGVWPYGSPGSYSLAVDSVRHRAYVSNLLKGTVTVFDRPTGTVAEVWEGLGAGQPVINQATNRIYIPEGIDLPNGWIRGSQISVVDGSTLELHGVQVGVGPESVAIDEERNIIYVANAGDILNDSHTLSVVDGTSETRTEVVVGTTPSAVALDPSLGIVVVANYGSRYLGGAIGPPSVALVDRESLGVRSIPVEGGPFRVVVNSNTGKAYVATFSSVIEVDERTGSTVTVSMNSRIGDLAVDRVRNKIYATHPGEAPLYGSTVSVIDGATHEVVELKVGNDSGAVAVDPGTGTAWTSNSGSNSVTAISEKRVCVRCPRVAPTR